MPSRPPMPTHARRSGFTLIEVLVVMGIIVLLVALALPAFSFITGSRSTEAAGNQISGALGVARAKAVGLQKICGIMFFIEPTSDNVQLALVQETDRPTTPDVDAGTANIDVYLDLAPEAEFVKLPIGVGIQTVTNAITTGVNINRDRYIGFNLAGIGSSGATAHTATGTQPGGPIVTRVGGVILFDGNGQLVAKRYALRTRTSTAAASLMGALLFYNTDAAVADANSIAHTPIDYIPVGTTAGFVNAPVSQLGLVLFDAGTFSGKGFTLADLRADSSVSAASENGTNATETANSEETWLDTNGTPTMINRYNGTLVRGE